MKRVNHKNFFLFQGVLPLDNLYGKALVHRAGERKINGDSHAGPTSPAFSFVATSCEKDGGRVSQSVPRMYVRPSTIALTSDGLASSCPTSPPSHFPTNRPVTSRFCHCTCYAAV